MTERALGLRQWGSLPRRRRGVLVVADAGDLKAVVTGALGKAGYAGAVIMGGDWDSEQVRAAVASADEAGLFVLAPGRREGDAL
jgi:hypothetical protein